MNYGHKGKGVLTHVLTERGGMPLDFICTGAKGNEKQEAKSLISRVWKSKRTIRLLQADRGYDAKWFRVFLLHSGYYPLIDYRQIGSRKRLEPKAHKVSTRWTIERTFSWLKRKYRRLAMRWERRQVYWEGFMALGIIMLWVDKLMG